MDTKSAARESIETSRTKLLELSHRIHAHPELGFEEERACDWMCEVMTDAGFNVERGISDLPTAFAARAGSGPLHIAICAEYDALPAIGHACGHNIIASSAAGAGLALARIADDAGLTITVLGTPAEEVCNAGGKIQMLDRGAFDGVHAAMMVHPGPVDMVAPPIIAAAQFEVFYTGKTAHASAFPELGINAADALTIAQTAVGLLRQHIHHTDRIHGIITKGGDAPNVIPAHTSARYIARASSLEKLKALLPRVHRCFEAGAIATGCKYEITGGDQPYAEMHHDRDLASLFYRNGIALGREFSDSDPKVPGSRERRGMGAGSTDMGNVSLRFPAIHPIIGIKSLPAVNHQPEFTAHCITEEGDRAVIDGAISLAWTAIDAATDPDLRSRLINRAQEGD
ncbi:MAG TPA: M20 family metallopeptidase [Candidatus Binataceae bacterium]|nr:M20 family metallopeptidase [Candidatus Binataceae bacterium]